MAKGINKFIGIGNLGADPELRYTTNGTAVANCRMAVNEQWRDKQTGETQERTEWIRFVCFGRQAEVISEFCAKGSKVYIEGRLQTRKWQGQDGQDRYTTEIVAHDLQMLDSRPGGGSDRAQNQAESHGARPPATEGARNPRTPEPSDFGDDELDDDIPF